MTRKEEIEKGVKYFKENLDRLTSLYKEMYGEVSCPSWTCTNSIEYAYKKMYKDRDKVIPGIKMKRSKVIDTHMWDESLGFPKDHFTFHNTTDELARRFIEIGYADYFI